MFALQCSVRTGWLGCALATVLTLTATSSARADLVTTGGFETGDFSEWTTYGNKAVVGSDTVTGQSLSPAVTVSPEGGSFQARLIGNGVTGIMTTLGVTNNTALFGHGTATNGSAISRTISVSAGDTLSFWYHFVATDYIDDDFAFVSVNGVAAALPFANGVQIGALYDPDTNPNLLSPVDGSWRQYQVTFASTGSYTIGVGVTNSNSPNSDNAGSPYLYLDDFTLTQAPNDGDGDPPAAPEPATTTLLAFGAAGLVGARLRRRMKAKAAV